MSSVTAEREVAKQTESVRLESDVAADARIAAAYAGKSLTEFLSDALRPIVAKVIEEGHAKREQGQKGGPKGKK
jgi:hypothetical protein